MKVSETQESQVSGITQALIDSTSQGPSALGTTLEVIYETAALSSPASSIVLDPALEESRKKKFSEVAREICTNAKNKAGSAITYLYEGLKSIGNFIATKFSNAFAAVAGLFNSLAKKIEQSTVYQKAATIGKGMQESASRGATRIGDAVKSALPQKKDPAVTQSR